MTVSHLLSRSPADRPSAAAARPIASRMPSIGSCGVVGALCSVSRPSACLTTTSVNVPPVSIASLMSAGAAGFASSHHAAADHEVRAGDERRGVGGEEEDPLCDLLGLGLALQRDDRRHVLEEHLVAAA